MTKPHEYAWVASHYYVGGDPEWRYQAICTCGWRGELMMSRKAAEVEALEHRRL